MNLTSKNQPFYRSYSVWNKPHKFLYSFSILGETSWLLSSRHLDDEFYHCLCVTFYYFQPVLVMFASLILWLYICIKKIYILFWRSSISCSLLLLLANYWWHWVLSNEVYSENTQALITPAITHIVPKIGIHSSIPWFLLCSTWHNQAAVVVDQQQIIYHSFCALHIEVVIIPLACY